MLESNANKEENVIVKKIEGPSVDDEYNEPNVGENYDLVNVDSLYEEEEPQKSKMKLILPLLALLVGGGAFYLIESSNKLDKSKSVASSNVETMTKVTDVKELTKKIIEEKPVAPKEVKTPTTISQKSEPKVEKKESTHYIEALAMPTVVEKNVVEVKPEKIKEVKSEIVKKERKIKELKVENIQEVKVEKIKQIVKKPRVKKVIVKKRKPTFIAHYEKIKPRIIRVKKGDSLVILAKRFYGDEKEYKRIVRANRRIRSAKTTLHLGEKLVIPRKDNKTSRRYIIVEKGNTLAMIAKKFYGDEKAVSKIVKANRKIRSSRSLLHVGQKVYVPR